MQNMAIKVRSKILVLALGAAASGAVLAYSGEASAHKCGTDTDTFNTILKYTVIPQQFPDDVSLLFVPLAALCPSLPFVNGFVDFEFACEDHDACYDTIGMSKADCDGVFHDSLRGACDDEYYDYLPDHAACQEWCYQIAGFMFDAVSEYGDEAYQRAQAQQELESSNLPALLAASL